MVINLLALLRANGHRHNDPDADSVPGLRLPESAAVYRAYMSCLADPATTRESCQRYNTDAVPSP